MYRGSSGQARSYLPRSFKFGLIRLDQPYPAAWISHIRRPATLASRP